MFEMSFARKRKSWGTIVLPATLPPKPITQILCLYLNFKYIPTAAK